MAMNDKDLAKFNEIKARVRDIRQCHNQAIEKNEFVHFGMGFMKNLEWVCQQLNKAHGIQTQKTVLEREPEPEPELEAADV